MALTSRICSFDCSCVFCWSGTLSPLYPPWNWSKPKNVVGIHILQDIHVHVKTDCNYSFTHERTILLELNSSCSLHFTSDCIFLAFSTFISLICLQAIHTPINEVTYLLIQLIFQRFQFIYTDVDILKKKWKIPTVKSRLLIPESETFHSLESVNWRSLPWGLRSTRAIPCCIPPCTSGSCLGPPRPLPWL